MLDYIPVKVLPLERFQEVLDPEAAARWAAAAARAAAAFEGKVVWNVNSTAKGGGVAEMLRSLLAYARGGGVDARWVVISGDDPFFTVTKRIHNNLHGAPGDGGDLGAGEKAVYEKTLAANAEELAKRIDPHDIVVLHDPQTAGFVPVIREAGAHVVWRCHVGIDGANDLVRRAWAFLAPYVKEADAYIFSREQFVWEGLDRSRTIIIPPSIDAFSAKNQELPEVNVRAILVHAGLLANGAEDETENRLFVREDGTPGRVDRGKEALPDQPPPPPRDAKIVTQVSRWDRLKDPVGVISGFAEHVAPATDAHLVVAGPAVEAVSDDPEGLEVLEECLAHWRTLPSEVQARVHLVCLPMQEAEENAAIVNALQRRSDIVVQKSIAEGFGLTVAEAMWKRRPVVASRVGGIQDQIEDGRCGLLLDDPRDLASYGEAVVKLLGDDELRARLGAAAQEKVRERFLATRHLLQYIDLLAPLAD
jgi:trehalose synthase